MGHFCGKWPLKIRDPMSLRHPVPFPVWSVCLCGKSPENTAAATCVAAQLQHIWSAYSWGTFSYIKGPFVRYLSIYAVSICETCCELRFHFRSVYSWSLLPYTKCVSVRYVVRHLHIYEVTIFWGFYPYAKSLFSEVPFHMRNVYFGGTLWGTLWVSFHIWRAY